MMLGDSIPFFVLAVFVYFIGHYGYVSKKWNYLVYVFMFTLLAGLFFGLGILNVFFPEVTFLGKIGIAVGATMVSVIFSLILLKLISRK
jgi:hypothetical protein